MDIKHITEIKRVSDKGVGLAVFATLGVVDRDGDVTLPGAFGEQTVKVLPAHDWGHVPIGKARIFEQGNEAMAEFTLNLEIEAARDWHAALKFDLLDQPTQQWSYGFEIVKSSLGQIDGKSVRYLESLRVHEVSPVVIGAGLGTRTLAMKHGDRSVIAQIADVRAEIESLAARMAAIKALRAADGRRLSQDRCEDLDRIKAAIAALLPLADELTRSADAEVRRAYSAFVLRRT